MSDLPNATPGSEAAASPSMGTAAPATGNIQPAGEAGQGATGADNFLPQGVDVNTLPPALRAELDRINKEMVRGFTTKTQQLAEERKKYEGYDNFKQKAELYEQIASQEEFVRQWNEYVEVKKRGGQNGQGAPNDASAEWKAEIAEVKQQILVRDLSEFADAFASAKDEKGQLLNPDFDTLGSLQMGKNADGDEYSLLRACVELSQGKTPQEKLTAGYKAAKQIRDQIFDEGRKHGMGKMLSKVRNATEAPTISSDKSVFTGDPKKLTVREARELAEKGLVVQ